MSLEFPLQCERSLQSPVCLPLNSDVIISFAAALWSKGQRTLWARFVFVVGHRCETDGKVLDNLPFGLHRLVSF